MNHRDLLLLFTSALSSAAVLPACRHDSIPGGCGTDPFSVTVPLAELTTSDGGAEVDAGPVAVGTYLDASTCRSVCTNRDFCKVTALQGEQATVECDYFCIGGRRPAGYRARPPSSTTPVGEHFARMAALEAASVVAFRRLSGELSRARAPRALVRGCERAARDEIRHARTTSALARRYGATVMRADVEPESRRSLEALAVENAAEGCVRETFGAVVAHWQAREAEDPVVRAAMKRIARDETRHAALSWAIDAWARTRLDRAARDRVAAARTAAARALVSAPAPSMASVMASISGLPTGAHATALAESLQQTAWRA